MSPDALQSFLSLALGFAAAGALTSGFQWIAQRPAGFDLLSHGVRLRSFLAVPFLVVAAPFVIMRNTLSDRTPHARRAEFVMMATILSGFWSLMSGTALVAALRALGAFG